MGPVSILLLRVPSGARGLVMSLLEIYHSQRQTAELERKPFKYFFLSVVLFAVFHELAVFLVTIKSVMAS